MPSERVREAREAIIKAICERTSRALSLDDGGPVVLSDVLDAYAAAVRAETLAEVREAVEPLFTWDKESHGAFLAALAQLEAT